MNARITEPGWRHCQAECVFGCHVLMADYGDEEGHMKVRPVVGGRAD